MDNNQIIEIVGIMLGMVGVVVPSIWRLSTKVQLVAGSVESLRSDLTTRMDNLEAQIETVNVEIKESRRARAEIWREVNSLRERARAIEVRVEK